MDPLPSYIKHQCALLAEFIESNRVEVVDLKLDLPKINHFTITKASESELHIKRDKMLFVEGFDSHTKKSYVIIAFRSPEWKPLQSIMKRVNTDPKLELDSILSNDCGARGQLVRLDYLFTLIQQNRHVVLVGHSKGIVLFTYEF